MSFHLQTRESLDARTCAQLGIESFHTIRVPHFMGSYAASLTFPYEKNANRESFKLTYSGDTKPCQEIIELGRDSTLLIHEATYPDRQIRLARETSHSTMAQAVKQGQLMNAEYTILTHFTKSFGVMPPVDQLPRNVGIAFDFMHVSYNDLGRMNSMLRKYAEAFGPRSITNMNLKHQPIIKRKKMTSSLLYDD